VLGGDTAGTGTDFFAGHVLDNRTGDQVAKIHHQFGERAFAEQMYCLGMYYNRALIGVETNYSTFPEVCLEELRYPKLYVRQRVDNYTKKLVDAFGFETTKKTRPLIIDGLKDVVRQAADTIHDADTLGEMLTFVYDENWKGQAEEGKHDDLVMSLAIAHFIRSQQTTGNVLSGAGDQSDGSQKKAEWTEDMRSDYNKASPMERKEMIRMWGRPGR
jgi:phage terminase large subunit